MKTDSQCIFCRIVRGEIPSKKVYEDQNVYAFEDLHPQAALHYLFIHKSHTRDVNETVSSDPKQIQDIFQGIKTFTQSQSLDKKGFRVVTNLGQDAGQTVFHAHFHVLAGEPLGRFGR